jgi:hypothetical protein
MSRRSRPSIVGLIAATATAAFAASPALAGWGPVLQPAASGNASKAALSVNGRGAVAAAWLQAYGRTEVVRAFATTPGRRPAVRTLRRVRDRSIVGLTTVLDARGELTVAWVERAATNGLLHGPITVRAAFRMPAGRWSPVQVVSRVSAFAFAEPRLAAAPDGTVALVFNAGIRSAPGMGVAWRTRGRSFGRVGSIPTGRHGYLQEPSLAIDDTGRAFLAGTAGCDASHSSGVLLTTPAHGRRFGPEHTIAHAPATHLRFVLTGGRRAIAAWVGAGCSTTEELSGPVLTTTVVDVAVGTPSVVSAAESTEPILAGAPSGGAELSFTQFGPTSPAGEAVVARLAHDGAVTAPARPPAGVAAVSADPAGDQLVVPARPAGSGPPATVSARPASADPVEAAPLPGPSFFTTASATDGPALAAARPGGRALRIAVWRNVATP